jgi:hypothetical protein
MTIMSPFTIEWHPVLRSLVLRLIVVPLAVYLVVPRLLALHHRLRSRDVPLTVFPAHALTDGRRERRSSRPKLKFPTTSRPFEGERHDHG